jgi:hypothetical protein
MTESREEEKELRPKESEREREKKKNPTRARDGMQMPTMWKREYFISIITTLLPKLGSPRALEGTRG